MLYFCVCDIYIQCFPHIDFTWASRPGIFVETFLFLLLLLSLTLFFLSARDNETIRDRLNSGKTSPRPMRFILLVLCAQELSTLPQTISSVSHTLIYLWRAATISTPCCHQLPHLTHTSVTLALYLVTFRPFWRLFSLNGYILTNLATFFFLKTLAMVQLEAVSSTVPRAWALTPGAVSPLSASILSSERQRSSAFSWP